MHVLDASKTKMLYKGKCIFDNIFLCQENLNIAHLYGYHKYEKLQNLLLRILIYNVGYMLFDVWCFK